jgi:hypothetical protein
MHKFASLEIHTAQHGTNHPFLQEKPSSPLILGNLGREKQMFAIN